MNLLGWDHWHVLAVESHTQNDYLITAERDAGLVACPHCGSSRVHKHETRRQLVMDTPLHGRRVGIRVLKKRYQCQSCHGSFYQDLPEMHPDHFMTRRLVEYIEREALRRTFASLAEEIGIDEKSIRLIFAARSREPGQEVAPVVPRFLGIDEVRIDGAMRCVLTNIEDHTIFDLLPERKKRAVVAYLLQLQGRSVIQWVTMDMWNPYRESVRETLPQARICVDKFHVVRMASDAVETVRKRLRSSLSAKERRALKDDRKVLLMRERDLDDQGRFLLQLWTANYPDLSHAHTLKEQFFAIYDRPSRAAAEESYNAWLDAMTDDVRDAFQPLITACTNWREEIFNFFDARLTNAYTEALNGKMKAIVHQTRGASFDVVRAKIRRYGGLDIPPRSLFAGRSKPRRARSSPDVHQPGSSSHATLPRLIA